MYEIVLIGVIEEVDDGEGDGGCKSNTLWDWLFPHLAALFVDVKAEDIVVAHEEGDFGDEHVGEEPGDSGGGEYHDEIVLIEDEADDEDSNGGQNEADLVLIHG